MRVVTYSHARNALKSILDEVVRDADVTIISRRDAEGDAVVMSLNSYNSIMETLHLTGNPVNAAAWPRRSLRIKLGRHKTASCSPQINRARNSLCARCLGSLSLLARPGQEDTQTDKSSDHRSRAGSIHRYWQARTIARRIVRVLVTSH